MRIAPVLDQSELLRAHVGPRVKAKCVSATTVRAAARVALHYIGRTVVRSTKSPEVPKKSGERTQSPSIIWNTKL
jgi:hypothetical protein